MGHLSTRQYARLVDEWVTAIGLRSAGYGTHSLRRTKAVMIYRAMGNLRAIQILLGHTKIENTVSYLGVALRTRLYSRRGRKSNPGGPSATLLGRAASRATIRPKSVIQLCSRQPQNPPLVHRRRDLVETPCPLAMCAHRRGPRGTPAGRSTPPRSISAAP